MLTFVQYFCCLHLVIVFSCIGSAVTVHACSGLLFLPRSVVHRVSCMLGSARRRGQFWDFRVAVHRLFFFSRLDKGSTSRRSLHLYYSIALVSILPEVSFKRNFIIRCEQSQKVELPPNPLHKSTSAQFTLSRDLSQIDVRFGLAGTLMTSAILSCEGNI